VKRFWSPPPAGQMPTPNSPWEAWVEYRLKRLEDGQQWMHRLILGALIGQFALQVLNMLK
jgi:hypothetical protein